MLSTYLTILLLIGATFANPNPQDLDIEESKPQFVSIENEETTKETPGPVYTFLKTNFDGQKVLDDVKAKVSNVVEKFSAKVPEELPSLKGLKEKSAISNNYISQLYKALPDLPIPDMNSIYNSVSDFSNSVSDSMPELPDVDMNSLVAGVQDTYNNINMEPVKQAGRDIVLILPTVAVLAFYGLAIYFVLALLFRIAGFAIATKMNTLRLASDVFLQAPEFVSRMMASDQIEDSEDTAVDVSRSNEPDQMNLMNLIRGAQKVSQALETYNQLNQK